MSLLSTILGGGQSGGVPDFMKNLFNPTSIQSSPLTPQGLDQFPVAPDFPGIDPSIYQQAGPWGAGMSAQTPAPVQGPPAPQVPVQNLVRPEVTPRNSGNFGPHIGSADEPYPLAGHNAPSPFTARMAGGGGQDQTFGGAVTDALNSPAGSPSATTPAPVAATSQTAQAAPSNPHDSPSNDLRRQSIRAIESDGMGGYQAVGPRTRTGDRAYGAYQVMGNNIGPWTQQVLGRRMSPQEFLANPAAQDKVFDEIFGEAVQKYGDAGAASVWFTGSPTPTGRTDRTATSKGTVDTDYVARYMNGLGQPLKYSNHENRHGTGEVVPGTPSTPNAGPGDAEFMQPRGQMGPEAVAATGGGVQADTQQQTADQIEQIRQMSLKERLALLQQFMQLGGFKPGEGSVG